MPGKEMKLIARDLAPEELTVTTSALIDDEVRATTTLAWAVAARPES
jgi:hypothetical protein